MIEQCVNRRQSTDFVSIDGLVGAKLVDDNRLNGVNSLGGLIGVIGINILSIVNRVGFVGFNNVIRDNGGRRNITAAGFKLVGFEDSGRDNIFNR